MYVQIFADFVLEDSETDVVFIASTGDSHGIAEVVDCFSRVSPSSHAVDGQDSGVIPSIDETAEDQGVKGSLREDSVGDIEPRIFPYIGLVDVQFLQHPIIQLSSDFKLQ